MGTGAVPPNRVTHPGTRIAVVGSTGSGKTTLAQRLAHVLQLQHVELDALHWGPDWTPRSVDEFRTRVIAALEGDRWVTDGNYSAVRDIVWARAETIVWLDYSLSIVWWRLARRTAFRLLARVELWGGNRERWSNLLERDNLFLWALHHRRHRRPEYLRQLTGPSSSRWHVVHLRTPRETRKWFQSLVHQKA